LKKLSNIKGTKVYTENGNYIGKIKDVYLEDKIPRIYGWLVALDRKISKKNEVKYILLKSNLVKSIKEVMIVNEFINSHIDKFKEEIN